MFLKNPRKDFFSFFYYFTLPKRHKSSTSTKPNVTKIQHKSPTSTQSNVTKLKVTVLRGQLGVVERVEERIGVPPQPG